MILSPQSLDEYTDQGKTNEILFTHLLTCLIENFKILRSGEAAVFIISSLSHSCPNRDQQNSDGIGLVQPVVYRMKIVVPSRIGCRYTLILTHSTLSVSGEKVLFQFGCGAHSVISWLDWFVPVSTVFPVQHLTRITHVHRLC